MNKIVCISHRGDSRNFQENTLAAFNSAIDKGAVGIEFDVHLDKSGQPVIVHDYLFDQEKEYLTLQELLENFSQRTKLEMEIKTLESGAIAKVSNIVEKFRPLELEVTSSVDLLFQDIYKCFPNDSRGLIFHRSAIQDWMTDEFKIYWIIRHLELAHANVLHLDLDLYFPDLVTALHQNRYTTHTHLKGASPESFARVQALGVDQFTFDNIDVLKLR